MKVRVGTRKSPLAMWQAEHFKAEVERQIKGLTVELVPVLTSGDRFLSQSLSDLSGDEASLDKGFFTKEIEEMLLANEIDIAVHSLKDLPTILPEGLRLAGISERGKVADLILANEALHINLSQALIRKKNNFADELSVESRREKRSKFIIGTSSLRRQSQLFEFFGELIETKLLRGNLNTRLRKLQEDQYDAILVAEAGLERLLGEELFAGKEGSLSLDEKKGVADFSRIEWEGKGLYLYRLNPLRFLPASAQGFLGIETREEDPGVQKIVDAFVDFSSTLLALSERSFLKTLEAGCHAPVASYARYQGEKEITLSGKVLSYDGKEIIFGERTLSLKSISVPEEQRNSAIEQGALLAQELLERGAAVLVKS